MDFYCKHFALNHSQSTMKVGTDAILLASFLNSLLSPSSTLPSTSSILPTYNSIPSLPNISTPFTPKNILDVGTGSGILSLCVSQIFPSSNILAIDIDEKSIEEANNNFAYNHLSSKIKTSCISLQHLATTTDQRFDFLLSNPPFFSSSLPSPNQRRTISRHNTTLSPEDFALSASKLLLPNALVALILPPTEMTHLRTLLSLQHIHLIALINIFPKPFTPLKRQICLFRNFPSLPSTILTHNFLIRTSHNHYTPSYTHLTSPFLL